MDSVQALQLSSALLCPDLAAGADVLVLGFSFGSGCGGCPLSGVFALEVLQFDVFYARFYSMKST